MQRCPQDLRAELLRVKRSRASSDSWASLLFKSFSLTIITGIIATHLLELLLPIHKPYDIIAGEFGAAFGAEIEPVSSSCCNKSPFFFCCVFLIIFLIAFILFYLAALTVVILSLPPTIFLTLWFTILIITNLVVLEAKALLEPHFLNIPVRDIEV
jgi:hypothetical protein